MLSPDSHEEACKLFVTWLHRLEERDKRKCSNRKILETTLANQTNSEVTTSREGVRCDERRK